MQFGNIDVMNHNEYPKTLKTKTVDELYGIMFDANDAMVANPGNGKNGYYADEINYCSTELSRRREAKNNPTKTLRLAVKGLLQAMRQAGLKMSEKEINRAFIHIGNKATRYENNLDNGRIEMSACSIVNCILDAEQGK